MNVDDDKPGHTDNPGDNLIYKNNRELFYSFDPENLYSRKVDYQYEGNQLIIKQSWDVAQERVDEVKKKIEAGELSPLAFYMEKSLMEVPMLAAYSEFPKRKVKKHLTADGFAKLNQRELEIYARVFDISVDELRNPDLTSGIEVK
jgi:hypothetical protein